MIGLDQVDVDFVKELRLRRWARENYAPPQNRRDSWHPIVLEEMEAKDAELANRRPVGIPYVPLPPGNSRTVHGEHHQQHPPRILHQPDPSDVYIHG